MQKAPTLTDAVNALEEIVENLEKRKENFHESFLRTKKGRFLDYANIVDEDLKIIQSLERKYGLVYEMGDLERDLD